MDQQAVLEYTGGNGASSPLGTCQAGEHPVSHPQCGFVGCVDLRLWAKVNRYRFRLEESYRAENNQHIKGDGRWYVEIVCRNGHIYPHGGTFLLAYVKPGVISVVARIPGVAMYQTDGKARVFKFPVDRLQEVAAILRPKRLGGRAVLTRKQRETLQKHAFKGRQTAQERT